ncbi:MAG TPA: PqqD family protein [Terriglobales bacterium]|nr:PqqD family protein [Terriglobales bacterium]
MNLSTQFRVNTPNVTHETIDGETVIVNLVSGNYYSLQGTGVLIWLLVERGFSVEAVIDWLKHRYPSKASEIEPCVLSLLGQLSEEDLIVPGAVPSSTPEAPSMNESVEGRFEPQALQKFTDMQELLLLDPIHEVDSAGWPHKKSDVTV